MNKFICPNCRTAMSLDSTDGTLTCISCGKSIPVTDFEHHEFGSIKNSQYINKYAVKNKDMHTDGFTKSDSGVFAPNTKQSSVYYLPFELEADDVKSLIYKKPGKLFLTQAFKKVLKEQLFEKMYVPVWSNDVIVKSSINAACTEFDGNVTSYYDVEKEAELMFEQFNTIATTMNGTLHIDSLFPYRFESAVCQDENSDKKEHKYDFIMLEADIPSDKYVDNIKKYADNAARDKLNTLLSTYSSAHNKIYECDSNISSARLVYLPVWKIPFGTKNSSEYLYVNGQTGKSSGKLPLSRLKSAVSITLTFAAIFGAIISAAYFVGI